MLIPHNYSLSERNRQNVIYVITQRINTNIYVNDSVRFEGINIVMWTHYLRNALWFHNEVDVEEYKALYVTPRKVSIVRIPIGEATR